MNQRLNKASGKYVCASRPRRFGKSMAEDILVAYYNKGCNSHNLISGKKLNAGTPFKHI